MQQDRLQKPIQYERHHQVNGVTVHISEVSVVPDPLTPQVIAQRPKQEQVEIMRNIVSTNDEAVPMFLQIDQEQAHKPLNPETVRLSSHLIEHIWHRHLLFMCEKEESEAKMRYENEYNSLNGKRKHERREKWQEERMEFIKRQEAIHSLMVAEATVFVTDFYSSARTIDKLPIALQEVQDLRPDLSAYVYDYLETVTDLVSKDKSFSVLDIPYRDGRIPIGIDRENAEMLKAIVLASTSQDTAVSKIANNVLTLYWKQAQQMFPSYDAPHVLFVHDYLYAAAAFRNPDVLVSALSLVNKLISKWPMSYYSELSTVQIRHDKTMSALIEAVPRSLYGNSVLPTGIPLSFEQPIFSGLVVADEIFRENMKKSSLIMKGIDKQRLLKTVGSQHKGIAEKASQRHAGGSLFGGDSLENLLSVFVSKDRHTYGHLSAALPSLVSSAENSGLMASPESKRNVRDEISLVRSFVPRIVDKESRSVLQEATSHKEHYQRIVNEYQYFVALNGDRFSTERDTQIQQYGIRSVTFYPVINYPLMQQIHVEYLDVQHEVVNVSLILGSDGNFYYYDGTISTLPLFVTNHLHSIILPRLEHITSGRAFDTNGSVVTKGDGERERVDKARRSHWRELPGNRYTLESHGAQVHIQEVREDYGIDTWDEILRRRASGSLPQDSVITYVRGYTKPGAVPNEITYDP